MITASLHSFLSFLLPFSVRWFYAFSLFALPRSLSLSLSLSLALSLSVLLALALFNYIFLSLALACPICHPCHVFHSPA